MKCLKENIGVLIHNLKLDSGFLDITPRSSRNQRKSWGLDQNEKLYVSKDSIMKVKSPQNEKIFAKLSRLYKELLQINNK